MFISSLVLGDVACTLSPCSVNIASLARWPANVSLAKLLINIQCDKWTILINIKQWVNWHEIDVQCVAIVMFSWEKWSTESIFANSNSNNKKHSQYNLIMIQRYRKICFDHEQSKMLLHRIHNLCVLYNKALCPSCHSLIFMQFSPKVFEFSASISTHLTTCNTGEWSVLFIGH